MHLMRKVLKIVMVNLGSMSKIKRNFKLKKILAKIS